MFFAWLPWLLALVGWGVAWRAYWRPIEAQVLLKPPSVEENPFSSPFILAELLPAPVVLLDPSGKIRHANREAHAQFGDSLGAVIRHPAAQSVLVAIKPEQSVTTTLELDVPVRRVVQASFRCWSSEFGGTHQWGEGVLCVLDDRSEAEAVDRMRADFIAYASHELRTPLASLSGFIETLQGPAADDPAAQQQFLAIMAAQAARMQRLIERLLYLSRVQRLEHLRPQEMVSVLDVMDRVLEESAVIMRNAEAELDLLPVEEDCFFQGDEDQLVQVLLNLIENAVKYGGDGVRIRVGAHLEIKGGVEFCVSDNGPGVDEMHVPRLTERFYRVERQKRAPQSGTGLGLAIVKHIVDRHGGRLRLKSGEGQGMTCCIWLPLAA
ncbi:sensor histidine kinase [Kozakia baliensis]|uniref:histidine kinase n=1 Tax=Kozakia baliensis TaxID=153496 RepID=A0A1D8UUW2_9PROT|nr:ATP-binding protein [Kozakia baliensis]AOX17429.1 hypothetical protein A0U89_10085 [Kozakia baliensis]